jgi:hypothetical protein
VVIDYTISIGNLVQVGAFAVMAIGAFFAVRGDIKVLRHDIKSIEHRQTILGTAFEAMGHIMRDIAVQNQRMGYMEKMIDELRHGKGLVRNGENDAYPS